jgi:hypothetical protein
MFVQENTIYNFQKFRKSLDESEIRTLPSDSSIKEILLKRRTVAKSIFFGIMGLAVLFYIVTQVLIPEYELILWGSIAFLALSAILGYFVYNKYTKDIANGEMEIVTATVDSAELNDNPLKSKVLLVLDSGRMFYMPSMAFGKVADFEGMIGKRMSIYFSPVSGEVLSMKGEGFDLSGYS